MYYVHRGLLVPLLLTLPDLILFSFFSSWNWASWRKTKSGVPLANLQATSPAESIHLWFVLQEKSNQQRYPELPFDLNEWLPYFFVFGVWYDLLWQHSIYYLLLLLFYPLYALQMHFAILLEYLWVLGHLYCDVETWQRKLIDKAFLLSEFSFKDDCFFFFATRLLKTKTKPFSVHRAVWLLHKRRLCWQEPDCQVEEAGLWEPLLPALHPNSWHQLWDQLHLQSAQEQAGSCKSTRILPFTPMKHMIN